MNRQVGPLPSASFERIPGYFLKLYNREILGWAANLERVGPVLRIRLATMPDVWNLGEVFARYVALTCTLLAHPVSGKRTFLIEPQTKLDAEIIAKHCEELPAIVQAWRKVGAENKRKKSKVDAVFDRIPDVFVKAYDTDIRQWGAHFKSSNGKRTIVFRKIMGAPTQKDNWGEDAMLGAALIATVEKRRGGVRLVIAPETEADERLIAKHCEEILRYGMPKALQ